MTIKNARKLRNSLLIVGAVMMLFGYIWTPFGVLGVMVMFSCLIPHLMYNKCPHCGRQLGSNEGDFCQFCGKALEE